MMSKFAKIIAVFLMAAASLTATAATRKYHPGQYVALYRTDGATQMIDAIKPGVVGMVRLYQWSELETSKGVYDFSKPQADMTLLAGQGMRLILQIADKTFNGTMPTPPYLQGAAYTQINANHGYTAIRWNPTVIARYNALMAALGKKFDGQPNFEGVATSESALSLTPAVLDANGYTPELYRDALINVLTSTANSFPTSRVFWFMNFLVRKQAYIANVATAVAPYGVVMGGPDVNPDNTSLSTLTYPYYTQFQGKMKLFGGIEAECYGYLHVNTTYPTKYWTPTELFVYARDKLHANYVIWTKSYVAIPSDSYKWTDAIPVIGANPAFN